MAKKNRLVLNPATAAFFPAPHKLARTAEDLAKADLPEREATRLLRFNTWFEEAKAGKEDRHNPPLSLTFLSADSPSGKARERRERALAFRRHPMLTLQRVLERAILLQAKESKRFSLCLRHEVRGNGLRRTLRGLVTDFSNYIDPKEAATRILFSGDKPDTTIRSYIRMTLLGYFDSTLRSMHRAALSTGHVTRTVQVERPYHEQLPLFACSGELEATSLTSRVRLPLVGRRGLRYWNVGTDGGGQPEIRFRIFSGLPDLACKLVANLGSCDRNGGHIHINVKEDEDRARRVYYALRYHLSWFRYLAPYTRRHSHWCAVEATSSDWSTAWDTKYSAVSANAYGDFRTIEVRLWPTSRRPDDWRMRAALMQAVAKWAEAGNACPHNAPINNATAEVAWAAFFSWTHVHEPDALRSVLRAMRSKARASRDRVGRERCELYVTAFESSGLRLQGYRRRRVTATSAAVSG